MTYSLLFEGRYNNQFEYHNDISTWKEVTDFLRNKLNAWVCKVVIVKYSSNDRILAEKVVTMGNLIDIATSANDKCIYI